MNIHLIYRFIPMKEVNLDFLEKKGREEGKMEERKGRRKFLKNHLYHPGYKCSAVHLFIFRKSPNLCSINVNEVFYPVILNALGNALSLFPFFWCCSYLSRFAYLLELSVLLELCQEGILQGHLLLPGIKISQTPLLFLPFRKKLLWKSWLHFLS